MLVQQLACGIKDLHCNLILVGMYLHAVVIGIDKDGEIIISLALVSLSFLNEDIDLLTFSEHTQ